MAKKSDWIIGITLVSVGLLFFSSLLISTDETSSGITSFSVGDKIGVIKIFGGIFNSAPINKQISKLRRDNSIKAIVLRIDSPGGGVGASQEIYSEVLKAREGKPIIVSMGSVAASGGYYVAAASNKIFANPGTITGSIGVIAEFPYTEKFWDEKLGIKFNILKSGKFKDSGSPVRKMTRQDSLQIQNLIMDSYDQFVQAIADGREMSIEQVKIYADGGVFTGRQAKEIGFVDELGNFEDAISYAAEISGIIGEPNLYEYKDPEKISIWDFLTEDVSVLVDKFLVKATTYPVLQYKMSF
ncbi:MAG: signal peptide peptidase SppA [Calditrichaeota bacterium]|nr:MAG: signal peptide peptidase SppA [Calditrichota bacterium]